MNNFIQGLGNYAQKASGFSAGLLVGSVLGAGTMLLLAPQSGKRTRAKIQNKSIELLDQTNEAMEDMVEQAGKKARATRATVRKQAKELEQSGKVVFDEQKKRLATLVEAGKTAVQGS
jgi:gas vesicle protein